MGHLTEAINAFVYAYMWAFLLLFLFIGIAIGLFIAVIGKSQNSANLQDELLQKEDFIKKITQENKFLHEGKSELHSVIKNFEMKLKFAKIKIESYQSVANELKVSLAGISDMLRPNGVSKPIEMDVEPTTIGGIVDEMITDHEKSSKVQA